MHDYGIAALADAACRDADANYQWQGQMSQQDCEDLLRTVQPWTVEPAPKVNTAPRTGAIAGRH